MSGKPKRYVPQQPPKEIRNGFELENVKARDYSTEQIDTCLALLCKFNGYQRVADIVRDLHGWEIRTSVLADWRNRAYPNRYASLLVELRPEIEEQSIRNYSDAVMKLQDVQDQAIERVASGLDSLDAKDAGNTLRNVATALGINSDKYALATGRPTSRIESVSADDILRNLQAKGYIRQVADVDSTAEELNEGEA